MTGVQVLHDLLTERGLSDYQIVRNVRVSGDSNELADIIYGLALTMSLQEERIDRKRKRKAAKGAAAKISQEKPSWSCFLVLPAVPCSNTPTFSIKRYVCYGWYCSRLLLTPYRLLELQQRADLNDPSGFSTRQTFLCLTDAANISYYSLQAPAMLP